MTQIRYMVGDVFEQMALIPDASVDLVMTSPPFLALRSYLPDDHPDKAKEIGSEPDPASFVDTLLRLSAEWRRILTPTGTLCVELGDTYSGSGGSGGDYNDGGLREGQNAFTGSQARTRPRNDGGQYGNHPQGGTKHNLDTRPITGGNGWPEAKCKAMIPELYRIALGYGIHPLTGDRSPAGRWKVRNVVTWCRPNPPVGALGDKFRPATSDMVIACTSKDRWFDLDDVRQPHLSDPSKFTGTEKKNRAASAGRGEDRFGDDIATRTMAGNPNGAPPLDYWVIPPGGYEGAHFAVYPPELVIKPIRAMCPRQVCRTCGEPRRRITDVEYVANRNTNGPQSIDRKHIDGGSAGFDVRADRRSTTTGWSDCGHDDYRNGIVLDPFAGSGTTLMVATGHGRDGWGIDIDERNRDLARERIGPLMFGDAA